MPTYEICMNPSAPQGLLGQQGKLGCQCGVPLLPYRHPCFMGLPLPSYSSDRSDRQKSHRSALHFLSSGPSFAGPHW